MRKRYPSAIECFATLALGLMGAPLALAVGFFCGSWGPVFLFCLVVLLTLYFWQPSDVDTTGRRSDMAHLGVVITFIWAVPLLLWSGFFYLNPK